MSIEDNKAVASRLLEALDRNDLASVPELCTPACAEIWKYGISVGPWADHHISATGLVGEGDVVVATVETHGRVVGDFYGLPGDGKPFQNTGVVIYHFTDGLVASIELYFDDLRVALGALGGRLVPAEA